MRKHLGRFVFAASLCTATVGLSDAPAIAGPLFLYDVGGSGHWFVNGEYSGQQVAISGTAVVEVDSAVWEPAGEWQVQG